MSTPTCGCTTTTTINCNCAVSLSSDCITLAEDLTCSNILKGQTFTEIIKLLDTYICERFDSVENFVTLINIGAGVEIYKGDTSLGKKQLRTLVDSGLINIVQDIDTITVSVDEVALNTFIETNQKTYTALNTGVGSEIYKSVTVVGDNTQFNLRKIKSSNSTVSIVEGIDDIDITVAAGIIPDGSETKITAGANVSVSGTGTIATPYVIAATDTNTTYSAGTAISLVGTTFNNTAPDQVVSLTQGGATTITGVYPNFTISSTDTNTAVTLTGGGSTIITGTYPNFTVTSTDTNTTYSAGAGLVLNGTVFNIDNLQKVITYPTDFTGINYTLTNADNNYEIIIDNGATAVTITVPSGLTSKIGVGFTQKGTADVEFLASATIINNPIGLKIKGQYYQTFLSQELNTNNYFLGGNTKI